jgi:hypothetical protein
MPSNKNIYSFKTAGDGQRAIIVFGPPGCGTSTVIRVLSSASETPNCIVDYFGKGSIPMVEEALANHEVVFVDVDGGIFDGSDIQALVDAGIISGGNPGCLVRLYAEDDEVVERCKDRPDYVTREELREWSMKAADLDIPIRTHSLTYVMIPMHTLEEGARLLALRANLTR